MNSTNEAADARGQSKNLPINFIKQSTLHLALIMDGNGRWAERRGMPRLAGHHAGERTLRKIVEAAPLFGITTLTVYAFSSDNWKRPTAEVTGLMLLLETHLARSLEVAKKAGVRITVIGRRDRIPPGSLAAIELAEAETLLGSRLHLRIAVDYSSRDMLLAAWKQIGPSPDRKAMDQWLGESDVDLLIRTGGEQRLSDFLLWECAYAELIFTSCLWPDFGPDQLQAALENFRRRERRYGGLPTVNASSVPSQPGVL